MARVLIIFFFIGVSIAASAQVTRFEHITLEEGLSQNTAECILRDQLGFLWIGTQDGLNRYDGYTIKVFKPNPDESTSISGNYVKAIHEDDQGALWVGTIDGGLNRLDPHSLDFTHFRYKPEDPQGLSNDTVRVILEDSKGVLWIGTDGGLNRLDPKNREAGIFTHYRYDAGVPHGLSHDSITAIHEDSQGRLLIGTNGGGLNRLDPHTGRFEHIGHHGDDPNGLSHDSVTAIHEDSQGVLWIGTLGGGLNKRGINGNFERYRYDEDEPNGLSHDTVMVIHEDNQGILWVGTQGGGLNQLDPQSMRFLHYRYNTNNPNGLNNDAVIAIHEDDRGTLWIGTNGGGLNQLNPKGRRFAHYLHDDNAPLGLSHNSILAIHEDRQGVLWIGTDNGGLNRREPQSQRFTHYRHKADNPHGLISDLVRVIYEDSKGALWFGSDKGLSRLGPEEEHRDKGHFTHIIYDRDDPNGLSHDTVREIHEDAQGFLWIGTNGGGLNRFDPKTRQFTHYRHKAGDPHGLSDDTIRAIHEDSEGIFWIGTSRGLNRFDPQSQRFKHYGRGGASGLSHDLVTTIHENGKGILWIGTYGGGLNRFDPATQTFFHFREKDGLINDAIYGILEDKTGSLWISTNGGLSRFDPNTLRFRNYTDRDGLQSKEFNTGAYFQNSKGEMFFGGIHGLNQFFPEEIHDDLVPPTVVLTDLLISNHSIQILRDGAPDQDTFSIPKAIHTIEQLTLSYRESLVTFEFSALHFGNPKRNQYAYKLVPFDSGWISTDYRNRRASYTNLPAGNYTLRVKASNKSGVWNDEGVALRVVVRPAPWKTWWAYCLYSLGILGVLACAWFARSQHYKVLYELQVIEKLQRVDQLKDQFMANTSHELRTPLNGIIGLAESLIDGVTGELPQQTKQNLKMIIFSGRRLANLVNDILDFAQINKHKISLDLKPICLKTLSDNVLTLSQPLVGKKSVLLINEIPEHFPAVSADENRLQQILHNLVGNAIKFTDNGSIRVHAEVVDADRVRIGVTDTGIGIPAENQEQIFESFEQSEGATDRVYGGTGLGLTVTKQLVLLHGGEIHLRSQVGEGATFSFTLSQAKDQAIALTQPTHTVYMDDVEESLFALDSKTQEGTAGFRLLIVDDDPINRQVLKNHLSPQGYALEEASNGYEALAVLQNRGDVDLVLLDIMMPRISGIEVCEKVRQRKAAHQLPIIYLTAKDQIKDLVHGLNSGANDYLTKPIARAELLARVHTHLSLLDITRNLEYKVEERTVDLAMKNQEILQAQKQLVLQEKMASMGVLTAGIAHELKNPLNFVNNFSVVILEMIDDFKKITTEPNCDELTDLVDGLAEMAAKIHNHGERANRIVESMMAFSQLGASRRVTTDLNCMVKEITILACHGIKRKTPGLEPVLTMDLDDAIGQVEVSEHYLSRVIVILINNAVEAVWEKQQLGDLDYIPEIIVSTKRDAQGVAISVRDNGVGISEEHRNSIFTPFFTTKSPERGHIGLGLSIAYDIMSSEHGGKISVTSETGRFTEMALQITLKSLPPLSA